MRRTSSTVRARTPHPSPSIAPWNRSASRTTRPVEATLRHGNFHWISGVDCCTAGRGERFLVTPALTCAFPMWTSMWTSVNHTSDIRDGTRLAVATLQEPLYLRWMPRPDAAAPSTLRLSGVEAMRALAHPTRIRMLELLRQEPLSASELARRLEIRFGSARFHLQQLVRGGLASPAGDRRVRGGLELLFSAPADVWIDIDPDEPGATAALHQAFVGELGRRLRGAASDRRPGDSDRRHRLAPRDPAHTGRPRGGAAHRGGRAPADPGAGRVARRRRRGAGHARPVPLPHGRGDASGLARRAPG